MNRLQKDVEKSGKIQYRGLQKCGKSRKGINGSVRLPPIVGVARSGRHYDMTSSICAGSRSGGDHK